MLEVHKHFVLSDRGERMVQIPIAQFAAIEKFLEDSGQVVVIMPMENGLLEHDSGSEELPECELEYEDGVLVVKSQSVKISAAIGDDRREDGIHKVGLRTGYDSNIYGRTTYDPSPN
jgi:hypothetical protein